jgi:glycosyltransferase involved in cell wall biosynthesis
MLNLSLILPVFNERQNLEYLVPQLYSVLENKCQKFEILVIDDNSTDNTNDLMNLLTINYPQVFHIVRVENRSLPISIHDGIEKSQFSNVMWLDADGSMDADSVAILISKYLEDDSKYIIGSRFVEGGGYKGQAPGSNNLINLLKNIKNSEDSFIAIYLSILFNKFLRLITSVQINDLTSGFIIGNKQFIKKDIFYKSKYGEYFVYLIMDLISQKRNIEEIGYYCKPRNFGSSKTSNNIIRLIILGIPYIKAAYLCKKNLKTS